MMWAAGAVAAMSSITFPAVSALISRNAEADQQGTFYRRYYKSFYLHKTNMRQKMTRFFTVGGIRAG